MREGRVLSLYSCSAKSELVERPDRLVCVEAVGIEGEYFALGTGYYSEKPELGRQATVFENETLEALARDHGLNLKPEEARRNVLTERVPLNHLVGHRWRIGGDMILEAARLSTPRNCLEVLTGLMGLFKALINRSGDPVRLG